MTDQDRKVGTDVFVSFQYAGEDTANNLRHGTANMVVRTGFGEPSSREELAALHDLVKSDPDSELGYFIHDVTLLWWRELGPVFEED